MAAPQTRSKTKGVADVVFLIDVSGSMVPCIDALRTNIEAFIAVWARHVTWARVLIAAVAALHESRVVHADLTPGNALLVTDPSLDAGYPPRSTHHPPHR